MGHAISSYLFLYIVYIYVYIIFLMIHTRISYIYSDIISLALS